MLVIHDEVPARLALISVFALPTITCSGKSRVLTSSIVVLRVACGNVYHYVLNVSRLFSLAHQFDVIEDPHLGDIAFKPKGRKFISQHSQPSGRFEFNENSYSNPKC